jgi:hypothetical protein
MTLGEFFEYLSAQPIVVMAFFIGVPLTALLVGWIAKGEGHVSPWKYLYSLLVYAVCIPGILATALAIYLFLFERGRSIYSANLLTQVLPVVSMLSTLNIIRRNVPFQYIPGFGKLSSLMMLICTVFILMYIMQRVNLIVWVNLPAIYFVATIVGLVLLLRWGMGNLLK